MLSRERQVRVASRRALVHARDLPRPSLVPELGHLRRVRDALHLDVRVADGNPEPLAQRRRDPADGYEAEEPVLAVDGEGAEEVGEEVDADPERRLRVVGVVYGRIAVDRAPARGSRGSCPVVSRRPPSALFPIAIAVPGAIAPVHARALVLIRPGGRRRRFSARVCHPIPYRSGLRRRSRALRYARSRADSTIAKKRTCCHISSHVSGLATSFPSEAFLQWAPSPHSSGARLRNGKSFPTCAPRRDDSRATSPRGCVRAPPRTLSAPTPRRSSRGRMPRFVEETARDPLRSRGGSARRTPRDRGG